VQRFISPELRARLSASIESHAIEFGRAATVRSNIARAAAAVRRWLAQAQVADAERCSDEMHDGIRCTRPHGHASHHRFDTDEGALRWKPSS
jgi:hypothetical protein